METKYIPSPRQLSNFRTFSIEFAFCALYLLYTLLFRTSLSGIQTILLIFPLAVSLYFFFMFMYRSLYEKIMVSPSGIRHTAFGYEVFTSWTNLVRIGKTRLGNREGIYLSRQPGDVRTWLIGTSIGQELFIPISIFADNWSESELGQQIKRYAPQLFNN